jgi:hypothetical protein
MAGMAMDAGSGDAGAPAMPGCSGLEVRGLTASPGGSILPNTCAPFDGALNNPYAIRCIDADPGYATGYPGDDACILPPPEELGTQIHIGPGTGAAGEFELAPGSEISNHYLINASNAEPRFYYRTNWRMRPGGHHMLIAMLAADQPDGFRAFGDMGSEFGSANKSFGGAQRPSVDRPQGTIEIPPENAGLGQQLLARQQFSFNLHHINTGDEAFLREVWINVWYTDENAVTSPIDTFAGMGSPADMAIAAGQHVQREYACAVRSSARIISLYGHYHAHGQRFGVWIERASGERVSVYESFDWADIPVFQFDSISSNPQPDVEQRVDGALSGLLMVEAGDALHFLCDIRNDSMQSLRFADEAITGEMCILFGAYAGANPCGAVQRVD